MGASCCAAALEPPRAAMGSSLDWRSTRACIRGYVARQNAGGAWLCYAGGKWVFLRGCGAHCGQHFHIARICICICIAQGASWAIIMHSQRCHTGTSCPSLTCAGPCTCSTPWHMMAHDPLLHIVPWWCPPDGHVDSMYDGMP